MLQFVRSDSVVSRLIAEETLIVPVRRGVGDLASIYSLNSVASTVWNAIAQPRTKSEIVELLCREFEASREIISSDVECFLSELTAAGLVSAEEAGVPA